MPSKYLNPLVVTAILLSWIAATECLESAYAHDQSCGVTYQGISDDGVDIFYGIHYAQDTGGANRFKPPVPYVPPQGSQIDATNAGPSCPQPKGDSLAPLYLSNVTNISEDCLRLNVYRPAGTAPDAKLPVFVYVHGGSFYVASKDDIVVQPEGLIRRSVEIGIPMIQVNINYRLGGILLERLIRLIADKSQFSGSHRTKHWSLKVVRMQA